MIVGSQVLYHGIYPKHRINFFFNKKQTMTRTVEHHKQFVIIHQHSQS